MARWIIFLAGSGWFFWIGQILIITALGLFLFIRNPAPSGKRIRQCGTVTATPGFLLVAVSATPLSDVYYLVAALAGLSWIVVEQIANPGVTKIRLASRLSVAVICLSGVLLELPWQIAAPINARTSDELAIIGDSITAGIDEPGTLTWPRVLAHDHQVRVHDFSRMGAGVAAAMNQAEQLPATTRFVLLEIGGNDLLGTTSVSGFESGLESLLRRVGSPERTVVMFELPLPPFYNRFGQIQRRLATRYGVTLIPKRFLIGVLTGADSTSDSIHLTQAGHQRMAQVVWNLLVKK